MRRLLPVLLSCFILVPVALAGAADMGDTSPSYGGSGGGGSGGGGSGGGGSGGGGGAPDKTAPFVGLTLSLKHLASLAHKGKLVVQVVVSEGCTVKLSGRAALGSKRVSFSSAKVKLAKGGLTKLTLKLSSKHRKALRRYVRAAKATSRGKVTLSGSATDGAGNRRHLSLTKKLKV